MKSGKIHFLFICAFIYLFIYWIRSLCFSCDGTYLASGSFDSNIHITKPFQHDDVIKTLKHKDKIVNLKWHPFLPILLSTSADKTARIWTL
jgi:WD40 repeat protein